MRVKEHCHRISQVFMINCDSCQKKNDSQAADDDQEDHSQAQHSESQEAAQPEGLVNQDEILTQPPESPLLHAHSSASQHSLHTLSPAPASQHLHTPTSHTISFRPLLPLLSAPSSSGSLAPLDDAHIDEPTQLPSQNPQAALPGPDAAAPSLTQTE